MDDFTPTREYHAYCDEASVTKHRDMVYGALMMSVQRVRPFVDEMQRFRDETGMDRELKCEKVSRGKFGEYKRLQLIATQSSQGPA